MQNPKTRSVPHLQLDFTDDHSYLLGGVSCHDKDYRFVWKLNLTMSWNLAADGDLMVKDETGARVFPRYTFFFEELSSVTVIVNHAGDGVAIPEWAHFDFLLKFENVTDDMVKGMMQRIRKIQGVQVVAMADPEKLKRRVSL